MSHDPHFIADAIRAHLNTASSDYDRDRLAVALLAVVDKCEVMKTAGRPAHTIAYHLEAVIARALNVAFPIDQADEARRLLGN